MYNAIIIGAGQIAAGYDDINSDEILTHAHAYISNSEINLLGFYDKNFEQAENMALKWGTKAYKDLSDIGKVDIVSICTPDNYHLEPIKEALKHSPKIIFLEKPISSNKGDELEIIKIAQETPILVNFSRRFVKEFQELAIQIKNNEYGEFQTGTGYYGKGYNHNGSHMRDLLELLLGKITETKEIKAFQDYSKEDLTRDVILKFNDANFIMQGINCNDFTIFELDLMFKKARIRILNSGFDIEIYKLQEDSQYTGYFNLELNNTYKTELNCAMNNAVSNIVTFLKYGQKLISKPGVLQ